MDRPTERTLRVLVVDDEGLIADTLAQILRSRAFAAEAVHSGIEAIERATTSPFDVLISDVVMPEMNGIEAANEIRKILPDCRVILISGNAQTALLLSKAEKRGYHYEILAKPIHPTLLIEVLEEERNKKEAAIVD